MTDNREERETLERNKMNKGHFSENIPIGKKDTLINNDQQGQNQVT